MKEADLAKSVQETSPDGPCVAKARAFHTLAHSVSVTGLGRGGGVNALGKFPKKKVWFQNFFCSFQEFHA